MGVWRALSGLAFTQGVLDSAMLTPAAAAVSSQSVHHDVGRRRDKSSRTMRFG